MIYLRIGVYCSLIISLLLLVLSVRKTRSFGDSRRFAEARGNSGKGIVYALGKGMLPWEKESASRHLLTYLGGVLYHLSIFAAILCVLWLAAGGPLPDWLLLYLKILLAAGLLCGIGLLIKRTVKKPMRAISCPDDFVANILVDFLVFSVLVSTLNPGFLTVSYATAVVVFLYIPLGKIRHCVFFFISRIVFGSYFGRRAVFPSSQHAYGDKK